MRDEQLLLELFKMLQSADLKNSVRNLNSEIVKLHVSMVEINKEFKELNENVKSSSDYLKQIAQINKNAERLTWVIIFLTIFIAISAGLEIARILSWIK